ncbi:hypothetical protein HDU80_001098, partial [Chytriomyces hyalinus]
MQPGQAGTTHHCLRDIPNQTLCPEQAIPTITRIIKRIHHTDPGMTMTEATNLVRESTPNQARVTERSSASTFRIRLDAPSDSISSKLNAYRSDSNLDGQSGDVADEGGADLTCSELDEQESLRSAVKPLKRKEKTHPPSNALESRPEAVQNASETVVEKPQNNQRVAGSEDLEKQSSAVSDTPLKTDPPLRRLVNVRIRLPGLSPRISNPPFEPAVNEPIKWTSAERRTVEKKMRSVETALLRKDSGKFLKCFHARNWLMTSANGGTHAIWDLDDESPFSKAPGLLLAGLMIPATKAMDISKNDQLVAVSYTNGSTYIWNMNQDQIGGKHLQSMKTRPYKNNRSAEKKLSNTSVLLHPDHSSSKPGQNKRISALCFNLSSSSYPFIALAYRDRVVFVDSRTKRHVHSQILQTTTSPVTAMHWSEVDGNMVATGNAVGEVKIWDVRNITGGSTAKFEPLPVCTFYVDAPPASDDQSAVKRPDPVAVEKIEWAPHCRGILMATRADGTVTMYNSTKRYPFFTHEHHRGTPVFSASWNQDSAHEGLIMSAANVTAEDTREATVQHMATATTAAPVAVKKANEFDLDKALKRALGGGVSGAAAMVVQVFTLMPMRTIMNYQYKYGSDFKTATGTLYKEGGMVRYYRGLGPALIQGPLSRFGDTASNAGALALLESSTLTRDLPMGVKTLFASAFAACFRMILTPVDTLKTTMQTKGAEGTALLRSRVKAHGVGTLWYGAGASAAATFVGHYPWFATYNMLQEYIPKQSTTGKKLARNAAIGFSASIVSDCISNSLRVIKT